MSPPGPLRILADTVQRLPNGHFRFLFEGAENSEVEVQGTSDFVTWDVLKVFTDATDPVEFIDTDTASIPATTGYSEGRS